MLQPQDQPAAVLVVAQHRARPVPGPPLAGAVGADRVLAHRVRKRQAAAGAPGRREKGDRRPSTGRTARPAPRRSRRRRGSAAAARRRRARGRSGAVASRSWREGLPPLPSRHMIRLRGGSSTRSRRKEPMPSSEREPITLFDRRAWRLHRERAARRGCVDFCMPKSPTGWSTGSTMSAGNSAPCSISARIMGRCRGRSRVGRGSNASSPPSPRSRF